MENRKEQLQDGGMWCERTAEDADKNAKLTFLLFEEQRGEGQKLKC